MEPYQYLNGASTKLYNLKSLCFNIKFYDPENLPDKSSVYIKFYTCIYWNNWTIKFSNGIKRVAYLSVLAELLASSHYGLG